MMLVCQKQLPEIFHNLDILTDSREPETLKVLASVSFNFIAIMSNNFIINVVTTVWTAHRDSQAAKYEKNFKQTNKLSLKTRATTARAQTAFRRTYQNNLPRFSKNLAQQ